MFGTMQVPLSFQYVKKVQKGTEKKFPLRYNPLFILASLILATGVLPLLQSWIWSRESCQGQHVGPIKSSSPRYLVFTIPPLEMVSNSFSLSFKLVNIYCVHIFLFFMECNSMEDRQ